MRSALHELAVCALAVASVVTVLAAPVVLWFLVAGILKLTYSYPP